MDKYQALRDEGTNGANYDLDTEDIIAHLREWDAIYGIQLSEVTDSTVLVQFDRLPDDVTSLATDIYAFCPDTIDQHFGCFAEMIEWSEQTEADVPAEILELVEGIDLDDDDYGMELLKRSLLNNKSVGLWWD